METLTGILSFAEAKELMNKGLELSDNKFLLAHIFSAVSGQNSYVNENGLIMADGDDGDDDEEMSCDDAIKSIQVLMTNIDNEEMAKIFTLVIGIPTRAHGENKIIII